MSETLGGIAALVLFLAITAAWLTHIFWCFAAAAWGFLLAGAIFFPIGVIHGVWLWMH